MSWQVYRDNDGLLFSKTARVVYVWASVHENLMCLHVRTFNKVGFLLLFCFSTNEKPDVLEAFTNL